VLDGEDGQIGVGDQVAGGARGLEESSNQGQVPLRRLDETTGWYAVQISRRSNAWSTAHGCRKIRWLRSGVKASMVDQGDRWSSTANADSYQRKPHRLAFGRGALRSVGSQGGSGWVLHPDAGC
jgi:hypothetical protein